MSEHYRHHKVKGKNLLITLAQIVAALFNFSVLFGIAVFLVIEAVNKLMNPHITNSSLVVWLGISLLC